MSTKRMKDRFEQMQRDFVVIIRENYLREWLHGFGGFELSDWIKEYFVRFADSNAFTIISFEDGYLSTEWLVTKHDIKCVVEGREAVCKRGPRRVILDDVIGYFSIDDIERYGDPIEYDENLMKMLTVYLHRRQIESRNIWNISRL